MAALETDTALMRSLASLVVERPQTARARRRKIDTLPPAPPPQPTRLVLRQAEKDPLLAILERRMDRARDQLLSAAETGKIEEVVRLVDEAGIDPNSCRGLNDFTPLHHACSRGHLATARQLLVRGASPCASAKGGDHPLHLAAYGGHRVVVELLLEGCAEVNAANDLGETALFHASRRGFAAIVRLLLLRGSNPSATDRFGDTAKDHARNSLIASIFDEGGAETAAAQSAWFGLDERYLLRVCRFLRAPDLCGAATVCSRWHHIAESKAAWRHVPGNERRWQSALGSALGSGQFGMAPFLAGLRPTTAPASASVRKRPSSAQPRLGARTAAPDSGIPGRRGNGSGAIAGAFGQGNGALVLGAGRRQARRPASSPTRGKNAACAGNAATSAAATRKFGSPASDDDEPVTRA